MRSFRAAALTALTALLILSTTGCGSTDDDPPAGGSTPDALRIVASTSWVGALAKAAGATDITLVAPANVQHPPDYEPKPSDLAAAADADFVLFAEFDGFAPRLKEAAGGDGHLVAVQLENTPAAIKAEVTRLAGLFGTDAVGAAWLSTFDAEYAKLNGELTAALPQPPPTVVSHAFFAYWAAFAGLSVAGTFGPEPVTAGKLAELTALKPTIVLGNGHMGGTPEIAGATDVDLVNFAADDLDLLGVFRGNAEKIKAALAG